MSVAKKGYISVKALANEWLTNLDYRGKIDEELLYRWANLRAEEIIDTEQLTYGLSILDIKDFVAQAPDGIHSIYVAGSYRSTHHKVQREHFLGYTQQLFNGCDVKVDLICPKCEGDCKCHNQQIDIQVDELYLRERPYLWAMSSTGYVGYSAAQTDGFPCTGPDNKFRLMRPFAHNDTLWNSEHYLGVCNALPQGPCYRYKIENGQFITDMKEGQVFIGYLRYVKDEDGYFMIPNYPIVVRAINAYITEMVLWREMMKKQDPNSQRMHMQAQREAESLRAQASSELEMPSPEVFAEIAKKHWHQDRGRAYYK